MSESDVQLAAGDKVNLVKKRGVANSVTEGNEYVVESLGTHGGFYFKLDNYQDGDDLAFGIYPSCAFGDWEMVTAQASESAPEQAEG